VIDARISAQEAAIIHEHVAGLLAVPAGVLSKLRAHGLARVQIGKGGVASFPCPSAYQGVPIPNAPGGFTWDVSRGAYLPSRREILLGTGHYGYEGTATHEVGHALGDILYYDHADVHRREYLAQASGKLSKRSEYYPKGMPSETGRKEFFAESVALGIMDPEKLKANFTLAYSTFILRIVLA